MSSEGYNTLDAQTFRSRFLPAMLMEITPFSIKFALNHANKGVDLEGNGHLSSRDLESCLALVSRTSSVDYRATSTGWSVRKKRAEMQLLDMRYLLVRKADEPKATNQDIIGFASFMLTEEDDYPVIYVYEIHLEAELRGKGLGTKLMHVIEHIGSATAMSKSMLTVFARNEHARAFYTNLGYSVDTFSPQPRKLRSGAMKIPEYFIYSKWLDHPHAGN